VQKITRWLWKHKKSSCAAAAALLLVAVNVVAFMQARAMTHFSSGTARTASPEALGTAAKVWVVLTGVSVPRPMNDKTPGDYGLPFSTHHVRSADGTDLEVWHVFTDHARGMVILCHSYAASKSACLPTAEAFYAMGFDTMLIDFRGSGGSSGDETTVGFREADDVAAVVAFARRKFAPTRLILCGQSMGASAVMRAVAVNRVECDAIIVEAPFDRLLSTVENRFAAMGLPAFPFARLLVFWGGVRQGYSGFDHNPVHYASKIVCPTLLMYGCDDPRVTRSQSESIYAHLAGPKRQLRFDRLGHVAFLELEPERWREAVERFLEPTASGTLGGP
jgi:alpha-beta hydrolase superfamily lysophospholipase